MLEFIRALESGKVLKAKYTWNRDPINFNL